MDIATTASAAGIIQVIQSIQTIILIGNQPLIQIQIGTAEGRMAKQIKVPRSHSAHIPSVKQTTQQLSFGSQFGKRQSSAEHQVNNFLKLKQEQLANVNADTTHPLLTDF